jgi:hypothetical protein
MPPEITNQQILDKAHAVRLEGEESAALVPELQSWADSKQAAFDAAIADVNAKLDLATERALTDEERTDADSSLNDAISISNNFQTAIRTIITPATEPPPEPLPEPVPLKARKKGGRRS